MIVLNVLASIAVIGVICCLLFYLAVYALPLFAGVTAGAWAYGTGAGWLGGIAFWGRRGPRHPPCRPPPARIR